MEHGYWKSLGELEHGGPIGPSAEVPKDDDHVDPLNRRNFMQLMGASLALAGVAGAGCKRYDREEIVPLGRRPEDMTPGNTLQYATTFELSGHGQALLATSYEGRPIHLDGNPEHPFAGGGIVNGTARHGGSTPFAQASILHLYDPDRSQSVLRGGKGATFDDWRQFVHELRGRNSSGGGANWSRVRILAEATSSPTVAALRERLKTQCPGLVWYEWEALSHDNERAGLRTAVGRPMRAIAHLDGCQTIVTLDADIFVEHPAALKYARDFARSRKPEGGSLGTGRMNRLYAIESNFTRTGVLADHRLPLRSEHILPFLQALDARLSGGGGGGGEVVAEAKVAAFLAALGDELNANRGSAALIAGSRQPAPVHALVAKINAFLGGSAVGYVEDPDPARPSHAEAIASLVRELNANAVDTVIIIGGNPVFDAPADLDFAAALAKAGTTVRFGEYADETSAACQWHVPKAHFLEAWGDSRTWDGTWSVAQPLILPLYGGLSTIELVASLLGDETPAEALVRQTLEAGTQGAWRQALHDGFVDKTAWAEQQPGVGALPPVQLTPTQAGSSRVDNGNFEVTFVPGGTWDGRFANNGWLQETPDFLTKVTWDNVALLAKETADQLGVHSEDMIRITVGDRKIDMPAFVMPGQARGSIAVMLGGGRTKAGSVGNKGAVLRGGGFNAYALRTSTTLGLASGARVQKTGGSYTIATTQDHWDIRRGMSLSDAPGSGVGDKETAARMPILVRETDVATFREADYKAEVEHPFFHDHHHGRGASLFKEKTYEGHRWAMAIDLGSCMGCNACSVACQSENNIPIVGKRQVRQNREMHWIRIDRYFKGDVADPEVIGQPVTCQHCENAPCEQVCPVGATLHSSEGLNDMVYNRCVGTRYCLNNCPYRVRRFNFLDWHKDLQDSRNKVRKLLFNPETTVRERGVMEKCTYCVQRIQNAKIAAKNDRNRGVIADGTITTACQAACPTEAIVFGDLMDPESRVSKLHADRRQYELLGELNDKPRTRFLARVKNPNPALVTKAAGSHGGH